MPGDEAMPEATAEQGGVGDIVVTGSRIDAVVVLSFASLNDVEDGP